MSRKLHNQPKTDQKQIEDLKNQILRLQADFDNYRKRTGDEKTQIMQSSKAEALLEILPVLDNFERSMKHIPKGSENSEWTQGIVYIQKQLQNIFQQNGLEKIQTIGSHFDPQYHEAISYEKSAKHKSGDIIDEIESGYKLGNQVLKVAKVRVAK